MYLFQLKIISEISVSLFNLRAFSHNFKEVNGRDESAVECTGGYNCAVQYGGMLRILYCTILSIGILSPYKYE